ncbi:hypothetical protein [uncultured Winogradskyella sp.]|uniref:hypothetical protein n=1 Tax=uncultured Winogradskyella sp. TaxID=395353 RepID=UPI00261E3B76|nr:hypothetical protein [uncultured Winogradskyella sp.]
MYRKIILTVCAMLFFIKTNAQCAMCRAVLESGEDQSAAEGINDGIMFLMVMPYVLVATIGYFVYRTYSKSSTAKKLD